MTSGNECIAIQDTTYNPNECSTLITPHFPNDLAHGAEGLRGLAHTAESIRDDDELRFKDGGDILVSRGVDPDLLRRPGGLPTVGATDLRYFNDGVETRGAAGSGGVASLVVVGLWVLLEISTVSAYARFPPFLGGETGSFLMRGAGAFFVVTARARGRLAAVKYKYNINL